MRNIKAHSYCNKYVQYRPSPTWSTGTVNWIEYDGASAGVKRSGTFANKPASADIYKGFAYFCTDKQTTGVATNGIMIYYKGQDTIDLDNPVDVWVDALGRVVS